MSLPTLCHAQPQPGRWGILKWCSGTRDIIPATLHALSHWEFPVEVPDTVRNDQVFMLCLIQIPLHRINASQKLCSFTPLTLGKHVTHQYITRTTILLKNSCEGLHIQLLLILTLERKRKWKLMAQSCLTLCDTMDCSLPGSSVHHIFQARCWSG